MEHDDKLKEMGRVAVAMCDLHLKDPKTWNATEILSRLFDKFEQLELEEDIDG